MNQSVIKNSFCTQQEVILLVNFLQQSFLQHVKLKGKNAIIVYVYILIKAIFAATILFITFAPCLQQSLVGLFQCNRNVSLLLIFQILKVCLYVCMKPGCFLLSCCVFTSLLVLNIQIIWNYYFGSFNRSSFLSNFVRKLFKTNYSRILMVTSFVIPSRQNTIKVYRSLSIVQNF